MRINAFFRERLKAKLHHSRMSWGAVNAASGTVFLRVGTWSIHEYNDGSKWAVVQMPDWEGTYGQKERAIHIELLKSGNPGYIIPVENRSGKKNVIVDESKLFRIGSLEMEGKKLLAELVEEVPTSEVLAQIEKSDPTAAEITEIIAKASSTTRKSLIEIRIGQGKFREDVLHAWNYRCAVTGAQTVSAIRASHILPWKDATNAERLDPNNGLPLVATIDALFDSGLISFKRDGSIMISKTIPRAEQKRPSINSSMTIGKLNAKVDQYMSQHRRKHFPN